MRHIVEPSKCSTVVEELTIRPWLFVLDRPPFPFLFFLFQPHTGQMIPLSSTPGGSLYGTTPGGTRISYDRNSLMNFRNSPLSKSPAMLPQSIIKSVHTAAISDQRSASGACLPVWICSAHAMRHLLTRIACDCTELRVVRVL